MLKGTDSSMQKVIPQARLHHSCVPCQCFPQGDDHAKVQTHAETYDDHLCQHKIYETNESGIKIWQ